MVIGMKKRMNDRAIFDAELIKLDVRENAEDEGEGKVRDGSSFEAGSQMGGNILTGKRKQLKYHVYREESSLNFEVIKCEN